MEEGGRGSFRGSWTEQESGLDLNRELFIFRNIWFCDLVVAQISGMFEPGRPVVIVGILEEDLCTQGCH